MKKSFKYILAAFVAVIGLGLSSCTDDYDYDPASKTDQGGNAFLQAEGETTRGYLPTAEEKFSFDVVRQDSTQAETVNLSSSNSKFNVPASVSFAAGQKKATVDVTFDIANGTTESTTIAITGNNFYYGPQQLTYTITRYNLFKATYVNGVTETTNENVDIYQIGDGEFLAPAASTGYDYDLTFRISDGNVIVPVQKAWYHPSYGDVYAIGDADGDASITASSIDGSGVAGTWDANTLSATLILYHGIPNVGGFGDINDAIVFETDPLSK